MRHLARKGAAAIAAPLLMAVTVLSFPAEAQTAAYVGFGGGQADNEQYADKDGSYKVFGGWRFASNAAVEASYIDLGRYGSAGQDYDHYGVVAQFVGHLPLGPSGASAFAKAGLFYWYGYSYQYGSYGYYYQSIKDTGTDLTLGAGLQFDIHRHWAVRAEWERFYDVAGGDITLVSASFLYRF